MAHYVDAECVKLKCNFLSIQIATKKHIEHKIIKSYHNLNIFVSFVFLWLFQKEQASAAVETANFCLLPKLTHSRKDL